MINVGLTGGPAGHLSGRAQKNFNIAVFSDTIIVINVQVCMMVLLTELYLFIPLSVTLTVFQGRTNVEQFSLKILCFYPFKLKLC